MKDDMLLNVERIRELMNLFGWKQKKLARRCGVRECDLSRLFQGTSKWAKKSLARALAEAFNLDISALIVHSNPGWRALEMSDRAKHSELLASLTIGTSLLSVARTLDSYLLPAPVASDNFAAELKQWEPDTKVRETRMGYFQKFVHVRREARKQGKYTFQAVGCPAVLAAGLRKYPELIGEVRQAIVDHKDLTAPCFIPDDAWATFAQKVSRTIGHPRWDKLNIGDNVRAAVWVEGQVWYTENRTDIERMRGLIEKDLGNYVAYRFPQENRYCPQSIATAVNKALTFVDDLSFA